MAKAYPKMEIQDERVKIILDTLLKYVQGDFSHTLSISENGDAFDAIATGLNAMAKKLKSQIKEWENSKNKIELVNKELEAFSYIISHDLRSPLKAIIAYSTILQENSLERLDSSGSHAIDIIISTATRMNRLIDELLNFSKVGINELNKFEINTEVLVREALQEIDSPNHHANVILNPLFPMLGDRALLNQVWINLLSNAFKYSSKKENPMVEIGSKRNENENIYYVKDNGAGFDMQQRNKLFSIFQRLHAEDEYPGIGIGLSLVSRIVVKHGGRVWAEGKVNEGAIFYFSLPGILA